MANIVETAANNGNFKVLVAAVKEAGLVEALSTPGPFTVFAPNDEAFAKLPEGTIEALLKDKSKLTAILTYHVVSGKYLAADISKQHTLKTLQGQELKVKNGTGVTIDNANVSAADIVTDNGVIHVIDTVLLPA